MYREGALSYEIPRKGRLLQNRPDAKRHNVDEANEATIRDIYSYDDTMASSDPGVIHELEDHLSEAIWSFDDRKSIANNIDHLTSCLAITRHENKLQVFESQDKIPEVDIGREEFPTELPQQSLGKMIDHEGSIPMIEQHLEVPRSEDEHDIDKSWKSKSVSARRKKLSTGSCNELLLLSLPEPAPAAPLTASILSHFKNSRSSPDEGVSSLTLVQELEDEGEVDTINNKSRLVVRKRRHGVMALLDV
eukprot:749861-Hanusia_phi.AAC.3